MRNRRYLLGLISVLAVGSTIAIPGESFGAQRSSRKTSAARKTPTTMKTVETKRSCGATTLPPQEEDLRAVAIDVDRDGAKDLVVMNQYLRHIRIAFADGPEVTVPVAHAGGQESIGVLRFAKDPKVFAIEWKIVSSGFVASQITLYRRSGCDVSSVTFPSPQSPTLASGSSTTSYVRGPFDELRCGDEDVVRTIHSSTIDYAAGKPSTTTKIASWRYRYENGSFQLVETIPEQILSGDDASDPATGRYIVPGNRCSNPACRFEEAPLMGLEAERSWGPSEIYAVASQMRNPYRTETS
jgi:hypothetical protein